MDFQFTAKEEAFRKEVHDYLLKEVPPWYHGLFLYPKEECDRAWDFSTKFCKKMADKGWLSRSWPKEYGGAGLSYVEQLVFAEEMEYFFEPRGAYELGLGLMSWILIRFGSDDLKKRFLPRLARAEIVCCQGFSEPNGGSDLAALQTRAVEQDDCYLVNGGKIWTSYAEHADYYFLATRTDPDPSKRHRGISFFVVDVHSPGVTIRPIPAVFGMHFNEVFLDDVRVPKENMIGEKNKGWYAMMQTLEHERSYDPYYMRMQRILEELVAFTKVTRRHGRLLYDDPIIRQKLADMAAGIAASRLMCYRVWSLRTKGIPLTYEASAPSTLSSITGGGWRDTATEILGPYGQLDPGSKWALLRGTVASMWRWGRCMALRDIQKMVVAQRGLGLPREPRLV